MAKFKIGIQVIETYNKYLIVDAASEEEAAEKVEKVWDQDSDDLYSAVTDCCDNQEVNFFKHGKASKSDIKVYDNLKRYDNE